MQNDDAWDSLQDGRPSHGEAVRTREGGLFATHYAVRDAQGRFMGTITVAYPRPASPINVWQRSYLVSLRDL